MSLQDDDIAGLHDMMAFFKSWAGRVRLEPALSDPADEAWIQDVCARLLALSEDSYEARVVLGIYSVIERFKWERSLQDQQLLQMLVPHWRM